MQPFSMGSSTHTREVIITAATKTSEGSPPRRRMLSKTFTKYESEQIWNSIVKLGRVSLNENKAYEPIHKDVLFGRVMSNLKSCSACTLLIMLLGLLGFGHACMENNEKIARRIGGFI
jgi:hypothetical protein